MFSSAKNTNPCLFWYVNRKFIDATSHCMCVYCIRGMPRDYFAPSNPDERMMMHISPIVFLQTRALTRISLLYGARIVVCGWSDRSVECISRTQLPGIKSLKLVGLLAAECMLVKRAKPVDWHVDSSGMCGWVDYHRSSFGGGGGGYGGFGLIFLLHCGWENDTFRLCETRNWFRWGKRWWNENFLWFFAIIIFIINIDINPSLRNVEPIRIVESSYLKCEDASHLPRFVDEKSRYVIESFRKSTATKLLLLLRRRRRRRAPPPEVTIKEKSIIIQNVKLFQFRNDDVPFTLIFSCAREEALVTSQPGWCEAKWNQGPKTRATTTCPQRAIELLEFLISSFAQHKLIQFI